MHHCNGSHSPQSECRRMLVEHLDPIEIYAAGTIVSWAWGIYHQSVGHSAIPADTCSAESKFYGGKDASPAGHVCYDVVWHRPHQSFVEMS
eukprot:scaffold7831_cov183-Skeletonema_marinoi.AAC.1